MTKTILRRTNDSNLKSFATASDIAKKQLNDHVRWLNEVRLRPTLSNSTTISVVLDEGQCPPLVARQNATLHLSVDATVDSKL